MAKVDTGGSPATPYFGEGGRAEATAEARGEEGPRTDAPTGVDRTNTATRERDEEGREVVVPQFEPGDEGAASAEPADRPVEEEAGPPVSSTVTEEPAADEERPEEEE